MGKQEAYRNIVSETSEEERNGKNKGKIDLKNLECKIVCWNYQSSQHFGFVIQEALPVANTYMMWSYSTVHSALLWSHILTRWERT